jgi:SAM-dependent methyltransferase
LGEGLPAALRAAPGSDPRATSGDGAAAGGRLDDVNTPERLGGRLSCNGAASADFDGFVLDLLRPAADDEALDIGPGLGKQMALIAGTVRRLVGLDRSPQMVAAVRARLPQPSVRAVEGDMDELPALDLGGPFSLAYAVYSLYYSADIAGVVAAVARRLAGPTARFVVVTPDVGNNAGWFADLGRLFPVAEDVRAVPEVGRHAILPALRSAFGAVTSAEHRSTVTFPTEDAIMRYYDACAPYCRADRREAARALFADRIRRDGAYVIDKRSLGLVARP